MKIRDVIRDLAKTDLFAGISEEDIVVLLNCVHARPVSYEENHVIIEEGARTVDFGVVIAGRGRAIKEDADGRVILINTLKKGSEIGVILAASKDHRSPVTVQALEKMTVVTIPFTYILQRCEKACERHDILLRNYISIVAEKGLLLHERIECLLKPTLREKIETYLQRVSLEKGRKSFIVPLDRNSMAEYLNANRSALSRELSRMKQEGLITYRKNRFKILK